jgi:ubiquinone/menaquinone biosynthesis C-methylase UbiE
MKASKLIAKANREIYKYDYSKIVMNGGFLSHWVYEKSHRDLERFALKNSCQNISIIELGAQGNQHRRYVRKNYRIYVTSDINLRLLLTAVTDQKLQQPKPRISQFGFEPKVTFEKIDASEIPYGDSEFNRLIATCLIVHISNPVDALEEWRRVVSDGGEIDFFVPCEPGLILRLARNLTHKRRTSNWKLSYDLLHYSQHKNHFPAINEFVKYIFAEDEIKRRFFPFNFLPWEFNLWAIYNVKVSKKITP